MNWVRRFGNIEFIDTTPDQSFTSNTIRKTHLKFSFALKNSQTSVRIDSALSYLVKWLWLTKLSVREERAFLLAGSICKHLLDSFPKAVFSVLSLLHSKVTIGLDQHRTCNDELQKQASYQWATKSDCLGTPTCPYTLLLDTSLKNVEFANEPNDFWSNIKS